MRFVIDFAYLLAAIAISPKVIYRMLRHNRYRAGWAHRLGKITRKNPEKKCIWLHAVSVGEVNATRTIVNQLKRNLADYEIVISTTTDTGFDRASALYGSELAVFHFPLDFSFTMKKAFENIKPAICLLMELEVWPNLVDIAKHLNIPVVVINGRISDRSLPKYRLIKPIIKKIFQKTSLILAQTEEYAKHFKAIGAAEEKVIVTGSLKYDTAQITDRVDGADQLAEKLNIKPDQSLWVAGGTGNNEEILMLRAYMRLLAKFKKLRLAIIPRKPERFDEVAQTISQLGLPFIRYSQIKDNPNPPKTDSQIVILGDTMGDLRKFYSLATVIFVGRSLVPMGGSDMTEAAALGKCTIFGPYTFNFNQTVDALLADEGAIQVKDSDELFKAVEKCLADERYSLTIAQNGREVIKKNQGATQRTIEQIQKLLTRQSNSTTA